jgi:putative protein kinase ArgK-like GTPase of G3E family
VDVVVLLLQPETGDDLQWEKAGLLEVADVVVVHKGDLPGADAVEAQVRGSLNLPGARHVPLLRVSAKKGEGLPELWEAVAALPLRRGDHTADGQDLLRLAQESLANRFRTAVAARDAQLARVIGDWKQGVLSQPQAVQAFLDHLAQALARPGT